MKKTTLLLISLAAMLNGSSTVKISEVWKTSEISGPSLRPGKDFALFFAINQYDHWDDLANPISEVEAIAKDLKDLYGFETDIVRNPDRKAILDKIEEYRKKAYDKDAQLLIFFSGHGEFNEATKQGYFVPKNGQKNDSYGDSYIEYEGLKRRISSLPCEHILLALDACYSGTADESIAMRGDPGKRPGETADTERERYISTSLEHKTRIMLTSGAKVRTPDKSQFAAKFLEALRSRGGQDGLLNIPEMLGYLTTASPKPVASAFEEHAPGGEFLFVLSAAPRETVEATPAEVVKDKTALDLAGWKKANTQDTKAAYRQYKKDFCPGGAFCEAAEAKINTLLGKDRQTWNTAQAANTVAAVQKYLADFPDGEYRAQANAAIVNIEKKLAIQRDEQAWKAAQEKNNLEAYKKYQADFPNGGHAAEAASLIKIIAALVTADDGLVFIKGGTFEMGCTSEQKDCIDYEMPVHTVKISDFYIGKYEVTQKLWKQVMGTNPSYFEDCDDCPVESVLSHDMQEFIKKLSQQTGRQYRLPTEAEWEYAARGGGQKVLFGNGKNILNPSEANFDANASSENSSYSENFYSVPGQDPDKTTPVGSFIPNSLGLYDMSGNVSELCSDWYGDYKKKRLSNPTGPSSGLYRVHRGGSWINGPQSARVACRSVVFEKFGEANIGFRLARSK